MGGGVEADTKCWDFAFGLVARHVLVGGVVYQSSFIRSALRSERVDTHLGSRKLCRE